MDCVAEIDMNKVSDHSVQLYEFMVRKGYPAEFSAVVANELHTEFTVKRMMGYLSKSDVLPLEEVADEMLAILSDRDRIVQKHQTEYAQAKINEMYRD